MQYSGVYVLNERLNVQICLTKLAAVQKNGKHALVYFYAGIFCYFYSVKWTYWKNILIHLHVLKKKAFFNIYIGTIINITYR